MQQAKRDKNVQCRAHKTVNEASERWQIKGMDCPGCVVKIETAMKKEKEIAGVSVSFSTHTMMISYVEGVDKNDSQATVVRVMKNLGFNVVKNGTESDSQLSENNKRWHKIIYWGGLVVLFSMAVLLWNRFPLPAKVTFSLATLWGLLPVMLKGYRQAKQGVWFSMEALMSVACLGALFIGEYPEAALVLILFRLGEYLESFASSRAQSGVKSLMQLTPDTALLIEGNAYREVPVNQLTPGDCISLRAGDRFPVDAELLEDASLDLSALTGESLPVCKVKGDRIMAGTLVTNSTVRVKVISEPGHNAIDRILKLIENADSHKAPVQRFIDKFSRRYTPFMLGIALAVVFIAPLFFHQSWDTWIYRGLATLLIACPCALVISTPAAVTSALACAARMGVLIKGGAIIERLASIKTIAFDKTGTLTCGNIKVSSIFEINQEKEWLKLAASIEQGSSHPLATAVVEYAQRQNLSLVPVASVNTLPGKGVTGKVDQHVISVLSLHYLMTKQKMPSMPASALVWIEKQYQQGRTVTVVCVDETPYGLIAFSDTLRDDAKLAIEELDKFKIKSILLTGDNEQSAAQVAKKLNIQYRHGLLPKDKAAIVATLAKQGPIAMVGDGINDAPALKASDIGIAMGKGSDTALEVADAALTHEQLIDIVSVIRLSRRTHTIMRQNISWAIGLKLFVLLTTLTGFTGLLVAVLADVGATVAVTTNALRLLKKERTS